MNMTLLKGAVALASIGKELLSDKDVQKVVSSVKATATSTLEKVGAAVTEMRGTTQEPKACNRPPEGWNCSRNAEHTGPCAARPNVPEGMTEDEVIFVQKEQIKDLERTIDDLTSVNMSLTAERNALKEQLDKIQKSFQ
jgi:hypothetical protein